MDDQLNRKRRAAQKAVERIQDGMLVGLGSGSTTRVAIELLGARMVNGLKIKAVSSSLDSAELARKLGIAVTKFIGQSVDVYIDGADEVDPQFNLIKGGGGALLREKVLAFQSDHNIIMVDESKQVSVLGSFPLPVEVNPFGSEMVKQWIEEKYSIRTNFRFRDDDLFLTDNGNCILDCYFGQIPKPGELNAELTFIPGILETGLFLDLVDELVVGHKDNAITLINPGTWLKDS